MAKLELPTLVGGYLDYQKLNAAFVTIEEWSNTVLSRDGTIPNGMEADLDLNGHTLLNTGFSSDPDSIATLGQVDAIIQQYSSGIVTQSQETQTATAGQTVVALAGRPYAPGSNNLAVFINGVRKFVGVDYTELSPTSFQMITPLTLGQKIVITVNDFYGTVTLPTLVVTWDNVANKPDTALRWPTWTEVTDKPVLFAPAAHQHDAADITTGRLVDARRGVYVQASLPTLGAGDAGALYFWG